MGKVKHLTPEQQETHEKAVKLRKMTDEQLIDVMIREHVSGIRDGVNEFIRQLKDANLPGIGVVTIKKIEMLAREKGYI